MPVRAVPIVANHPATPNSGVSKTPPAMRTAADFRIDASKHIDGDMRQSESVNGNWSTTTRRSRVAKRGIDLLIGALALLSLSPILLAAGIAIKLTSQGPVLFRQTRIGQYEKPFSMLKLRTMSIDNDDSAHRELNRREILGSTGPGTSDGVYKLENDPRITPVGRFLRRSSIDELPQLINVIRGDMSLVGPRPSLPWEVELYSREQRQRHRCLPGITGLWQVSGRNRLSMPEMLDLDVEYSRRGSLLLDLWILVRTPYAVLVGGGAR
jgi:lipopolysaccharide/colanic/teichoic acid biosynthesis glycosyltransferase